MSDGKISDEEFERLRQENQRKIKEQQKGLNVNVTIDNESQKFAEKQAQSAEERAEELQDKLDLIMDAQAEKLLNEIGVTDPEKREELKANPDMLLGYKEAMKDAQKQKRPEITGSAPLSYEQLHGGARKEGYSSEKELIEDLTTRSHMGDRDAEKILGKLLEKSLQGVKEGKKGFGQIETPKDGETELERLRRIQREKNAQLVEGRNNQRQ